MKRILACLLILVGFFVASCEEEEHEHHRYGYRERGYRDGRYGYGYRDGYYGRGYRLMDETAQSEAAPAETTAQP